MGGLLVVRFMHDEVRQCLLVQFKFLELHYYLFLPAILDTLPHGKHTSQQEAHFPHRKRVMDRYHIGTNHVRPGMPGFLISAYYVFAAGDGSLSGCLLLAGKEDIFCAGAFQDEFLL